ncbi:MAG: gluconeogenesis factor YvcK family protein [Patescibacteria group bacterium]
MKLGAKICTIGGGSGMPVINKALVKAGFENIKSIVTTFDSGGDTGRMRTDERGQILAFSDYWRALISLWKDGKQKRRWEDMLKFRDGRGRNFGNTFFQFMSEKAGDLANVDSLFSELTKAKVVGEIIPVATKPANVCFETISGKIYIGEHLLDELRMSMDKVVGVWLEPEVEANEEALRAIRESDVIIICPGSMYGSVIVNLLPRGVREAYNGSKAKKILMTNIMSVSNENDGFDQNNYAKVFEKYLMADKCLDLIVMANLERIPKRLLKESLKNYEMERSFPIKYDPVSKAETVVEDIAIIEKKNLRLRHSDKKLSKFFLDLSI